MTIQTMLYIYLAVCISMILFNCAYAVILRGRGYTYSKEEKQLSRELEQEFERISKDMLVSREHQRYLRRLTYRVNGLLTVDALLSGYLERQDPLLDSYLRQVAYIFSDLLRDRRYKSAYKQALLTYFCARFHLFKLSPETFDVNAVLEHTAWNDTYCRENALKLVYSSGRCEYVMQALLLYDQSNGYHNEKMITDGLLTFSGDKEQLATCLWKKFGVFSLGLKVCVLNYFRFGDIHRERDLLSLLEDERQDDEIRFSCIRYFGKIPYQPAYSTLIAMAEKPTSRRWEYASIANTALVAYPSERTVRALKCCLSSPNWYIRLNAAKSLEALHYGYMELIDVIDGSDRYAREIMQYCMDLSRAKEKGAAT